MTDLSPSSSVAKKRVLIHRQVREMAKNVLGMCIEERQNNNLTFTLNNTYDRASRYTGISKRTLAAIQNEAKKGPLCSPSKRKRPCNKKTNLNVDDFDRGVIHRIIEEFYFTKKIVPTCIKLLAAIRDKIEFPWGVTSLRKLLKDMGYRWLKCHNKRRILVERPAVAYARLIYLQKIRPRDAQEKYKIPKSTLQRKRNNKNMKNVGRPTELNEECERDLVEGLIILADWGYPLSQLEIRLLVKSHLDSIGVVNPRFKENIPGEEWCLSFLERHKSSLSERLCSNIKRARSELSREELTDYFNNLQDSLIGVSPENIINYDETNMSDDPGRRKVLIKRGSKRADRIIDSSKSSTSVMFSVTATGALLPLYVVYKAEHMHSTWTLGGWPGTRYNRSRSGWFDGVLFEDFLDTVIIKYFDDIEKQKGEKCLKLIIGDNLSSHLSLNVIKKCREHGIRYVFMPPNATHLCQPLDVAFFRALKQAWRNKLTEWKLQNRGVVPKDTFPRLLKYTLLSMGAKVKTNIIAGFKAAGIYPYNPNYVLKRLPEEPGQSTSTDTRWSDTFLEYLKKVRERPATQRQRRTKLNVLPGQSVTESHFDRNLPSTSNQIEVVCYPSNNESEQTDNDQFNDNVLEDPLMMRMQQDINYETDYEDNQLLNAEIVEQDVMPMVPCEDINDEDLEDYEDIIMREIERDNILKTVNLSTNLEVSQTKDKEGTRSVEECNEAVQENEDTTGNRQKKKGKKTLNKDENNKENIGNVLVSRKHVNEGDFVLVTLDYNENKKKPVKKYFIAKITALQPEGNLCRFLRKSQKTENTFVYPAIEDEMLVKTENIVKVLSPPTINRGKQGTPSKTLKI